MPPVIPAGPYQTRSTADGTPFPYYILPFDKDGRCEGPLTRQHLLDNLGGYSDIFVFSHGWNNDWDAAIARYDSFISGYSGQRAALGLAAPDGYRPLLVGIFWPSQALAWFESETGPGFAGAAGAGAVEPERSQLAAVAAELPAAQRERFHVLMQSDALAPAEARELAQMLLPLLGAADDEGLGDAPDADDLLAAAAATAQASPHYGDDDDDIGTVGGGTRRDPGAAGGGWRDKLDPRNLVKPFTVWQMKDRAGKVGSRGVAPLLDALLRGSGARIHLLGHSFGAKVVMSAAASLAEPLPRKLHSALLLQPAVSQYAFAATVPGSGLRGGYHANLARIERPVACTFSAHDAALTGMFHKALRRASDLGEQPAAAGAPSRYGALGGFGPQASGETLLDILDPPAAYALGAGGRIVGVRGDRTIKGHGDISNPSTWWLAHSVAAGH